MAVAVPGYAEIESPFPVAPGVESIQEPPEERFLGGTPDQLTLPGLRPERTVFVLLSFEGPDPYSLAGGLGRRVSELANSLAEAGFETHLFFIGDPERPGYEAAVGGRLHLHRWCNWISRYHPA